MSVAILSCLLERIGVFVGNMACVLLSCVECVRTASSSLHPWLLSGLCVGQAEIASLTTQLAAAESRASQLSAEVVMKQMEAMEAVSARSECAIPGLGR